MKNPTPLTLHNIVAFIILQKNNLAMKIINTLSLFLIALLITSCAANQKEKETQEDQGKELKGEVSLSISYEAKLDELLTVWKEAFLEEHPGSEIEVVEVGGDKDVQLQMISGNLHCQDSSFKEWRIPVARAGVIPIINPVNPYIDFINEKGLSRDEVKKVFTGEITEWGELLGTDSKEQINVIVYNKTTGATANWARFLEMKPDDFVGEHKANCEEVLAAVRSDPYAMSYCNAANAYDLTAEKRVEGILALPIDFNGNGKIDPMEKIYEDLCSVQRAAYLGVVSSELCNCIFFQADQKPEDPEVIAFIEWVVTDGQQVAVDNGFARIKSLEAEKIIKDFN